MGDCFSKNTSTRALSPSSPTIDLKPDPQQPHNTQNDQQVFKKEIFVIKHRISHEIDRKSDQDMEENPSGNGAGAKVRSSSCSKEHVDAILLQCGRLSRSNSTGAQNPNSRRRYSSSKRSFDFDLNTRLKNANNDDSDNEDDDDVLNHRHRQRHRQHEVRVSSPGSSSRRSSRDRDFSRQQRSSSKERRISISPSRRSDSPFHSLNATAASGGGGGSGSGSGGVNSKPAKMVSVPATDKSCSTGTEEAVVGVVKRIHVKRNVSPAKRTTENQSQSQEQRHQQQIDTWDSDQMYYYRRKSLVEIDNNAARSAQSRNMMSTRKLSRDLDKNPETPSYASLLLEDIQNFHQKNTNAGGGGAAAAAEPPSFALPECVTKACSIMEAVADLNSNTSSLLSGDKWRYPTTNKKDNVIQSAAIESQEPNSVTELGRFQRDFLDYPRKGIGRGRTSAYSIPTTTIVAST